MKRVLTAGTRKSLLAVEQTRIAAEAVKESFPETEIKLCGISTKGDRNLEKPLGEIGDKGLFVSEIERLIYNGSVDFAVHSGKDLPMELYDNLEISAVLKREDRRDVLVTVRETESLEKFSGIIGTGSGRRITQCKRLMPGCGFKLIRGNINTRLEKLKRGEYDGIILAAAGLKRLGLYGSSGFCFRPFSEEEMIPAACQGIIVLESKKNTETAELLKRVQSPETRKEYDCERYILKGLGGDCSASIGASVRYSQGLMSVSIMYGERRTGFSVSEESFFTVTDRHIKKLLEESNI